MLTIVGKSNSGKTSALLSLLAEYSIEHGKGILLSYGDKDEVIGILSRYKGDIDLSNIDIKKIDNFSDIINTVHSCGGSSVFIDDIYLSKSEIQTLSDLEDTLDNGLTIFLTSPNYVETIEGYVQLISSTHSDVRKYPTSEVISFFN